MNVTEQKSCYVAGYLLLATMLGGACGVTSQQNQSTAIDEAFPRLVKSGELEIRILRKPRRIISLTPSNDEILCALVDEKRIAGLSKFSQDAARSYVAQIAQRINIFVDRNVEQIVSLHPDLVLAARYTKMDLKSLLSDSKIPLVVTTDFRNFADVESNIRLMSRAVGEEKRAEVIIKEMREKLTLSRSRLRDERVGRRVLYLASGNFSAGSGTLIHEILVSAGLKNAAAEAGVKGHAKLTLEQIIQINPEMILIASGYERDRGFRQALKNDAQLSVIKAIKENRIVEVPARSILTVSHHVADAVDSLIDAVNQMENAKGRK